jgi:hypothetical protein
MCLSVSCIYDCMHMFPICLYICIHIVKHIFSCFYRYLEQQIDVTNQKPKYFGITHTAARFDRIFEDAFGSSHPGRGDSGRGRGGEVDNVFGGAFSGFGGMGGFGGFPSFDGFQQSSSSSSSTGRGGFMQSSSTSTSTTTTTGPNGVTKTVRVSEQVVNGERTRKKETTITHPNGSVERHVENLVGNGPRDDNVHAVRGAGRRERLQDSARSR